MQEFNRRIGQYALIKHRRGEQAFVIAAEFWEAAGGGVFAAFQ